MPKLYTYVKTAVAIDREEAEALASEAGTNGWDIVSLAPFGGSDFILVTIKSAAEGSKPLPAMPRKFMDLEP